MPKSESPSFLEALAQESDQGRPCDLSRAFDQMTPEFAAEVRDALGNSSVTGASISRTLSRFGFSVTEGAVRRCRRTCKCWRS